jgi:K+-sensing histidine kinase KdpD
VKSAEDVVKIQRHQAVALVSSAQWMRQSIRSGEFVGDVDELRVALAQLKDAIDATSAQLDRQVGRAPLRSARVAWRHYLVAVAAVLGATALIKVCCLLGSPRTVGGLYVPVVVATAMLVGRWPALLGCALAFVLNDVLFVTPGRFAPGPDQIAVAVSVIVSCLVLNWLVRGRTAMRLLAPLAAILPINH